LDERQRRAFTNTHKKKNQKALDMNVVIENLSTADVDATDSLLREAYKNQHPFKTQILRHLSIQPDGAFVAKKDDGEVVGFGAAIDYGPFSYVGLMATHPRFQYRGIARKVLQKLLEWLDARKCPTILLDASVAGAHLYENMGFLDKELTYVFSSTKKTSPEETWSHGISILEEAQLPELLSFDSPIFGASREALLRSYLNDYPDRFIVSRNSNGQIDGYLVAQARVIGPWVSRDFDVAERLISQALKMSFESEPLVFVSGSHTKGIDLLKKLGFVYQRSLRHMRKGKPLERRTARQTSIFGQASLGFG
jgi:ribosomal protein S18 acetylase RimI-like enzyme